MGDQTIRRMGRMERSQEKMRVIFLILSAILVTVGLILAVMVFFYLLRFTFNPQDLDGLVTDWATLLSNATSQGNNDIIDPKEGPARWFAIATLLTLGFLLSRIPLLLIRMGTSLFHASQDYQRQTKMILQEVVLGLRHADTKEESRSISTQDGTSQSSEMAE